MSNYEKQVLQDFFPGLDIPQKLISTTRAYAIQSQLIGSLRAEEEAGRYMICAQLAIESLTKKLNLPAPARIPSPMPPKMYANLLNVFRNSLGLAAKDSSPTKSPQKSPQKSPLKSPSKTTTPRKRILTDDSSTAPGSASPSSQVKKRGGPRSDDPTSRDIERLATGLGANDEVLEAVIHGYKKYHNLVRDRWSLLCGIFYVVLATAQPELMNPEGPFKLKLLSLVHSKVNQDKLEEWIVWAHKIVGDQSWVKKLAVDESTRRIVIDTQSSRKHSSGIGNMISYTVSFDDNKIEEYNRWYNEIMEEIDRDRE